MNGWNTVRSEPKQYNVTSYYNNSLSDTSSATTDLHDDPQPRYPSGQRRGYDDDNRRNHQRHIQSGHRRDAMCTNQSNNTCPDYSATTWNPNLARPTPGYNNNNSGRYNGAGCDFNRRCYSG